MSTPALDLKTFLDNLGTLGDIRIGTFPASPNSIGAIFEYGGQAIEGLFGVVGVGYERPSLQVVFRGEPNDYEAPMSKARIAWAALAGIQPGVIFSGSAKYLTVIPQQSPFSLGQDSATLCYKIACNFYIRKEPS